MADIILFVVFAVAFTVGYVQGVIRQLLGFGVAIVAFLLAANLRAPLGGWFAQYWSGVPTEFSAMFGFGIAFVALVVLGNVLITAFYKKTPVFSTVMRADAILGGLLAFALAMIVFGVVVFVLDSFYLYRGIPISVGDVGWLRSLHEALDGSAWTALMRATVIPAVVGVLGPLLPEAVRTLVP
jgi:uncharacterized membrane protein required for colicin V production